MSFLPRLADALARFSARYVPDSFTIACLLTLFTFAMGMSLGGATPGTFYLAGEGVQAAIRVSAETSRIRLLIYRKGKWRER